MLQRSRNDCDNKELRTTATVSISDELFLIITALSYVQKQQHRELINNTGMEGTFEQHQKHF